jgi:hypothetical protein
MFGLTCKAVLLVLQVNRKDTSTSVQQVFTDFGCVIRTRLGLHDGVGNKCSNAGLIVLELVGDQRQHRKLAGSLNKIKGVKTKLVRVCF